MTSNINSATIDETFPVAGKDNDTQGFRNNFGIIKSNFATAKEEITNLQDTAAKLNVANNFVGNTIIDAKLQQVTDLFVSKSNNNLTETAEANISYLTAPYQRLRINTLSSTYTINLTDWPTGTNDRVYKLTVELLSTSGNKTISWASTGMTSAAGFKTSSNWPTTFTVLGAASETVANPIIVEFWTYDGGATVFANYLGPFS